MSAGKKKKREKTRGVQPDGHIKFVKSDKQYAAAPRGRNRGRQR